MKTEPEEPNPKPKREDFDRVLTALLMTPPVTLEDVHKETRKRKKKARKVIPGDITEAVLIQNGASGILSIRSAYVSLSACDQVAESP